MYWRLAWGVTGISAFYLVNNFTFLTFGLILLFFEIIMETNKNKPYSKHKNNSLWYAFWWMSFAALHGTHLGGYGWLQSSFILGGLIISLLLHQHMYSRKGKKTPQKRKT